MRQTSAVLGELVKTLANLVDEQSTDICTTSRLVGDVTQIYVQVDMLESGLRDCIDELCSKCSETEPATKCNECRWHKIREGFR